MARPSSGNWNSITGDGLVTKAATDAYRSGWDLVFGKKEVFVRSDAPVVADLKEPSNTSLGSDVVLEDEASSQ